MMRMCEVRMLLVIVVIAAAVLASSAAAGSAAAAARAKQPRATRGFKNTEMMTARGFGKRAQEHAFAREGLNNPDNFWDLLENSQERNMADQEEKMQESLPLEWFAEEMMHNGDLARSVVRKFIDLNQDGILSSDELLRNVY